MNCEICASEIPNTNRYGIKMKPSIAKRRRTCSPECDIELTIQSLKENKAPAPIELSPIDKFLQGAA